MADALDAHCGSAFWDSSTIWHTEDPDFPECFQKTVFVWIPAAFLWLFLPFEIYIIRKNRRRKLPWTSLNGMRLFLSICLTLLTLVELFYWVHAYAEGWMDVPSVNYYSTFTKSVTFMLTAALSFQHRRQGQRSSGVLFIFWFLLFVSATVAFRTCLIDAIHQEKGFPSEDVVVFIVCVISYPMIVGQLILSAFSDLDPKDADQRKKQSPSAYASFPSRLTFTWFDRMAVLGFRRPLTREDLWDLSPPNTSSYVFTRFQKNWQTIRAKVARTNGQPSILSALWKTYWRPFLKTGTFQFTANLMDFTTPFIIKLLIDFTSNSEPPWRGYLYAFMLLSSGCFASLLYTQQYWTSFRMGLRVRASIIATIYRKAIRMSSAVKQSSSTGEIVNLMAIDTQHLSDVLPEFHGTWSGIIQIGIAFYMLWTELGPAVLAGLATLILMIPLNGFVTARIRKLQTQQMKFKDQRIKLMNEILAGMKVLKLYAWETSFGGQISGIRNQELKMLRTNAYLFAMIGFLYNSIPVLVTLATFGTYVLIDEENLLDAKKVFVSMALFNILRFPLIVVPMMIAAIIQSSVSLKRINKFINEDELAPDTISHDHRAAHPIMIENGTFAWNPKGDPILTNINLVCLEHQLVAVLGPVGCGKSSLISAVLGEMEKRGGTVNTKGTIAYVAQQAWIQNATLRDNITFGLPYDEVEYEKIIEACALKPDLELLPGGDQTEIGERGINLSGGQKQRISLARAVYSNADIILLDDPLSAVDAHVGKHIFEKVISRSGLLKDKTCLFITNSVTHLSQMDLIVVLKDGTVSETGTYDELLKNEGAFAEFLLNYLSEQNADDLTEEELADLGKIARNLSRLDSIASDTNSAIDENNVVNVLRRLSRSMSQDGKILKRMTSKDQTANDKGAAEQKKGTTLMETEIAETGKVQMSVYMKYISALGVWSIVLTFFPFLISTVCNVYSNIWLSEWSQDPLEYNPELRDRRLGVYGALGFVQMILMFFGCITLAYGSVRASRRLHATMLDNILRCPLSFFDTTPLGRIVNRFSKDIDLVDIGIPLNIRPMLATLLGAIAILLVITISTPLFLTVIVPITLLYYFVQRFYIETSRQIKRLESISRSPIFSHFSETLTGTNTIRAYGRSPDFIRESERRVDEYHTCFYPSLAANRWLGFRLQIIGTLVSFGAALFAVIGKGSIEPGTVGLSVSYASSIVITLIILVRTACDLEANVVAVERIQQYVEEPNEAPWTVNNQLVSPTWPEKGVVEFRGYATRYRPGLDLILHDVTCTIHSEEKIGVVGRTGAGKSSLALALFRIIEPAQGAIVIDGVDTTKIGLMELRSRLTIIPQDPVLFSGTLRINLDPFGKYSDSEVWQSLEHSHLKPFILSLPNGLNHEISEGGENLSVGQRQLVCLARALLRKTKVLVLDEATAAVDLETDDLIQATIRKEFADCTVITIAHRLNTIMDSTRIMVLDQGRIKEFDTPANLMQDHDSVFYSLAKDAGLI